MNVCVVCVCVCVCAVVLGTERKNGFAPCKHLRAIFVLFAECVLFASDASLLSRLLSHSCRACFLPPAFVSSNCTSVRGSPRKSKNVPGRRVD